MLGLSLAVQSDEGALKDNIGQLGAVPLEVGEVIFHSEAVDREMRLNVVLPKGYKRSKKHYPVLYMLHGLTSNYHEWKNQDVPYYLNRYDMIVVMVDGGNSWYTNWAQSDGGQKNNFEDYITNDIIGYVDGHYRTIPQREGRAICGLSMGGYGALVVGLRNPELFCSLSSHSGALQFAENQYKLLEEGKAPWIIWDSALTDNWGGGLDIEGFGTQRERTPKGRLFLTKEDIDRADPFQLVLQIPPDKMPHIHLDCGWEDGLIKGSRAFRQLLEKHEIPFTYAESTGGHEKNYWAREVATSMAIQYSVIQRNLRGKEFKVKTGDE
jgi:S-formylglutathione hydrolase FrmB